MTKYEALGLFHRLWGKAHDSKNYDKEEWMKLSEFLYRVNESKEDSQKEIDWKSASSLVDRGR